jgi:hypothetical protein
LDWVRKRYRALAEEREVVITFWSEIVKKAIDLAAHGAALEAPRKHVLDRAAWAVTEVRPAADWKIFRQRYWSESALAWAEACLPTLSSQTARARAAETNLRHEHVHTREKATVELVSSCGDLGKIEATLRSLEACIVTKAEAKRLDRSRAEGWARYADKNVMAIDLETGLRHPLPEKPGLASSRQRGRSDAAEETLQMMEELLQLDGEDLFEQLHHQRGAFWTHWDYCQKTSVRGEGNNAETLKRIKIAIAHFREHADWDAAIQVAWNAVPMP